MEIWLDPGGGVTPHIHSALEERFEVLAGNPSFLSGRAWSTAAPGGTVVVPAGARHAYGNRGGETAHMVCHAKPPSTLQEFLGETACRSRSGHREMVVLLFPPMPPRFVQRLLFGRK